MDPDRDAGLVDHAPEGVESRVSRGGETGRCVGRSTLYADDPGIRVEDALQFSHRGIDIDEGDHGRREYPFFVGVAPVVLEPPVECFEGSYQRRWIICERLLHSDPKRWEKKATIKALTIHDGQASVSITVLGTDGLEVAKESLDVLSAWVLPSEIFVEAARLGYWVEHGVGNEPVQL